MAKKAKTVSKSAKKSADSNFLSGGLKDMTSKIADLFSKAPGDVVAAIKADHDGLRSYLKILKDTDKEMSERRRAYGAFKALLQSHSSSEEKAVYAPTAKLAGHELHLKVAEGYVEHQLADDLMARIAKVKNPIDWSAHVNVIAEIVEHHLDEEESDLLPLVRKTASPVQNAKMLKTFIALREKTQKKVTPKNAGVLK